MTALLPAPSRIRRAARSGEALVFTTATAVALLHALDDAFLHRQPGVGLGQHALAAAIAVVGALAAVAAFPFLRPGLRAGLALSFGSLALVNGFQHLNHISVDGPSHSDLTGVLAAAAGLVLFGLAGGDPVAPPRLGHVAQPGARCRRAPRDRDRRARPDRHGAVRRPQVARADRRAAERGVRARRLRGRPTGWSIKGWYRPSSNGATMLVVHGGGGDRTGAMRHAQMLARNGYGVLVYDARGRGESEGSPNGYGWDWEKDVSGALSYLHGRPTSTATGSARSASRPAPTSLLHVAAERDDLAAVVSDGAAATRTTTGRACAAPISAPSPAG